jgi:hypothetical protein
VNTSPPAEVGALLQRGIAAARSGRCVEARQMLEQVVEADPNNEMGWLWLSGLVATNSQKRICLEQVLRSNPRNGYARAGIARLVDEPSTRDTLIEERLASVTLNRSEVASSGAEDLSADPEGRPRIKRLKTQASPSERRTEESQKAPSSAPPSASATYSTVQGTKPTTNRDLDSHEVSCPACDEPVAMTATECPHCFISFRVGDGSPEAEDSSSSSSRSRRRKGFLSRFLPN